ncbi:ABC transporter permease [Aquibacillus albus]|uniref:Peptide/nickel transport system permease protein n=1 Tax=Aquibacillus albus TaxID=1168171 RepID=A0ABS2N4G4_9BACI|nr:ABC transporter permease [Aquibacillus albus]MBM7573041.1 peptide/nickel transport system permease protein [Aquibacillus albus]
MTSFIIQRLLQTIVVLFLVTIMVFTVMHMVPGNPILVLLGPSATKEQIALYTAQFGLDKPVLVQYFSWVSNVLQGDFGESIIFRQDIGELIATRLPITVFVGGLAYIISVVTGMTAGVIAAVKRGGFIDSLITITANLGMATPIFWLGILGIYLFSLQLGWLPVQGFTWLTVDLSKGIKQLIMPVLLLSTVPLAMITRQTRSAMLEVIQQDYIRTGRSKGLKEKVIIIKHALRNALIPVITLLGIQLGNLVGGSVLVEQVFNIPGMGTLLVQSMLQKDFLIVQSCVLIIATVVALCNLAVDIAYGFIDPRIRYK